MLAKIDARALVAASQLASATTFTRRADAALFNWDSIQPSDNISWTPCGGPFQCARLSVPLDRTQPQGPRAAIALQAILATNQSQYQGSVLFNPGGPGESGTSFVNEAGTLLAQVLGSGYDVIGFDPRGTGATIPSAQCFEPADYDSFALSEVLALHADDNSVALARAHDAVVSAKCASSLGSTASDAGAFMDTSSIATDMLSIIRALGQEKLNYWGISYGTVLGQYFAAMYPQNVGIFLLDGVIDAIRFNDEGVQNALQHIPQTVQDGDAVVHELFTLCAQAGSAGCPLYEKSAAKVQQRFERIFNGLVDNPLPVPSNVNGPFVITQDVASAYIYNNIYEPISGFPAIAAAFHAIETNNQTFLSSLSFSTAPAPNTELPWWLQENESHQAIECTDMPPDMVNATLAQMKKVVRDSTSRSKWLGPTQHVRDRLQCVSWPFRAANRFTGPLEAKNHSGVILFASNKFDPVTPLADARAVKPQR